MNWLLTEIRILKALPMRARKKCIIRNWGKGDLCYIWQKFCPTVMWKAESVNDEVAFYLRCFPSRVLKVQLGFFLMLSGKCEKKEINWGGNCLKKKKWKEPGLGDLGNSHPIKIVKDAKNKRFSIEKACSEEKRKKKKERKHTLEIKWRV